MRNGRRAKSKCGFVCCGVATFVSIMSEHVSLFYVQLEEEDFNLILSSLRRLLTEIIWIHKHVTLSKNVCYSIMERTNF